MSEYENLSELQDNLIPPEILDGYELRVHHAGDYMMSGLHLSIQDGDEAAKHTVIDFSIGAAPSSDSLRVIEYDGDQLILTRDPTDQESMRLYYSVNSTDPRLDSRERVFASKILLRKILEQELFNKVRESGRLEYFRLLHEALFDETDTTRSDCQIINRDGVVDPNTSAYQAIVKDVMARYVDPKKVTEPELLDHLLQSNTPNQTLLESLLEDDTYGKSI